MKALRSGDLLDNMESLSPKSLEQTDKSKKYDRQLRLWGDHGQQALENAHICLINASAVGTEILKSVILPGCGSFMIIDPAKVTVEDTGANFFLDSESIGKSRAEVAVQYLLELNPDVHGTGMDDTIENLIQNDDSFFKKFTVVIATCLSEEELMQLSAKLWEIDIPLIVCRTYGLTGYARIQVQEHSVVEAHPDSQVPDLRLIDPFPSLKAFLDNFNLESMDSSEHSHVPYVVVLYKYMLQYKQLHNGNIPNNYKEKEVLKNMILNGRRKDPSGLYQIEENFDEAAKAVHFALSQMNVPSRIREILDDEKCLKLTSASKPFWVMVRALKDFIENEGNGCLPVRGTLPDMTAETKHYIQLQQIYRQKAIEDAEKVFKRVQELIPQYNLPTDLIGEDEVKLFCKCADQLYVLRTSSISEEYCTKGVSSAYALNDTEDSENLMHVYVILRSVEHFFSEYKEYPGVLDDHVEPDIGKLKECVSKLLTLYNVSAFIRDDIIHEFCRYGGAELHSVSAFLGACVAQEVIKLVTHQYKPFQNTLIYSAITNSVAVFNL